MVQGSILGIKVALLMSKPMKKILVSHQNGISTVYLMANMHEMAYEANIQGVPVFKVHLYSTVGKYCNIIKKVVFGSLSYHLLKNYSHICSSFVRST